MKSCLAYIVRVSFEASLLTVYSIAGEFSILPLDAFTPYCSGNNSPVSLLKSVSSDGVILVSVLNSLSSGEIIPVSLLEFLS